MAARRRVGILISGRGSNMAALLTAASQPTYPAEIVLVLSNRPDAAGLDIARQAGIATATIDHKAYPDRAHFDAAIDAALDEARVEILCSAGFMRILTEGFVARWQGRMINIHPSLLPAYPGLHTHARALADGAAEHGCTVHFVVPEVDAGPIIAQARVPVLPDDTEELLAARVLAEEHDLYVTALAMLARGEVRLGDGRAVFADGVMRPNGIDGGAEPIPDDLPPPP